MVVDRGMEMALLLNQEVSAVVTAMRKNSRWAMVPTRYTVRAHSSGHGRLLQYASTSRAFKHLRGHFGTQELSSPANHLGGPER